MMLLALAAAVSCVAVRGDRIVVGDLAKAVPVFASAPAADEVGPAPAPRVRRSLSRREMERLAARYSLDLPPGATVCFEGAWETITEARLREALDRALAPEKASYTLLEFSHYPAPIGELEFAPPPRTDSAQPTIWRGSLRYGPNRSVPVWARVKLVWPPREVERGDEVEVEVVSGATRLKLAAQAESGGKPGELVLVRNPASGARFRARVAAKGKVTVDATVGLRGGAGGGGRNQPGR